MNLVTFTTLYPNSSQPRHGVFVENRLRQLVADGSVNATVIAPVPWFPFKNKRFGKYAVYATVPHEERRHGIRILHPRYLVIPKMGMYVTGLFLALGSYREFIRLRSSNYHFEIIDAHYFYPDGVAACLLSKWLKKKFIVTARGTDINLIPKFKLCRKQILWAAKYAHKIITVSQALNDEIVSLGVKQEKVVTLRNGVNLDHFKPMQVTNLKNSLARSGKIILSVGHLIERKGHHIAIEAMQYLDDCMLVIVGGGEWESKLHALREKLGLKERVKFVGEVAHQDMPKYFNIADILVLPSSREGMANVLLESLACGTPLVAYNAWGAREVIADEAAGALAQQREAKEFAAKIKLVLDRNLSRDDVRAYACQFGWEETTSGQKHILSEALSS